jgi:hypothetical protein
MQTRLTCSLLEAVVVTVSWMSPSDPKFSELFRKMAPVWRAALEAHETAHGSALPRKIVTVRGRNRGLTALPVEVALETVRVELDRLVTSGDALGHELALMRQRATVEALENAEDDGESGGEAIDI